nr:uncharacterized protein LOC111849037 [Paramormyrops kingsleyae]
MHPLSTVEQKEFIDLIQGLSPHSSVMSRRTLCRRIDCEFDSKISSVKDLLKTTKHLCTTADIWSTSVSSFIGVTAHWVHNDTLERQSVTLACRHFPSPHTYNQIAEVLDEIHSEFGLSHECIVATVTDNGSNIVKAFKEFSITIEEQDEEDGNEDLSFVHIDSSVPEYNENGIVLPTHLRCACHTLSLVATTDAKIAIRDNPSLSRLNNATMGKCSALWNASGRPKSAEKLSEVLNCGLITPCPTRWNSLYDSLNQLNTQRGKLGDIMLKLNLPSFRDAELDYLEEYTKILKPFAVAIDRLQDQSSCYYAELLPTLFAVKSKLEALRSSNFRYCSHLLQAIMDGFRSRFSSFLQLKPEVNEAILASVTHPYFKMRWLPQQLSGEKKRIHELMIQSAADLGLVMESGSSSTTADGEVEDFFVFTEDVEVSGKSTHSKAELETLHFLEDQRKELEVLDQYPLIRQLFVRFNTIIPSSAPVERLFSFAGLINRPHRRRLKPNLFEKLVVLKGIE